MTATNSDSDSNVLVSVIIPAFNCELYISQAIQSVLQQTYENIECIVVDDGSTDHTASEISKFGNRVKYIRQENAGASAARNNGIANAEGEYIAFLDADDFWAPNKIEIQIQVFREYPEVSLVSTESISISENEFDQNRKLPQCRFDKDAVSLCHGFSHVYQPPFLLTSAIVLPTVLIREIEGFDESLKTAEDMDLYMRCCWNRTYVKIHLPLVCKQNVADSLGECPNSYQDHLDVMNRFIKNHPEVRDENEELILLEQKSLHLQRIKYLLFYGAGRQARRALRHSTKLSMIEKPRVYLLKSYFCYITAILMHRNKKFKSSEVRLD